MEITGTVKKLLEQQSGESQKGPWRRQEFILETEGNYPKEVCIVQWGDNIDSFGVQLNERLTVSINIASREYNERWYTDVTAWRVERDGAADGSPLLQDDDWYEAATLPQPRNALAERSLPRNALAARDDDDGLPF